MPQTQCTPSKNTAHRQQQMINFTQAIREALSQAMQRDDSVVLMGLGCTDPKGVFGTTLGFDKTFGPQRVFDLPVSENAMTGVAVGLAISGFRPVMSHQRADFALMSMDQIINNAAKWHYMYGAKKSVPLVIRTIVGRGWGQGPQHSQNFQALFAHIPGLKVAAPTTPFAAKGLLTASIEDNNPVIFIEHRWLSNQMGYVPEEYYKLELGKAKIMREGSDVTVIASMDMALEAMHVAQILSNKNISVEVLDICSVKPLDERSILQSVAKTGRALILDSGWPLFGVSAEIAAVIAEKGFDLLKTKIMRIGLPDAPVPTSPYLSRHYYPSEKDICAAICELLGINLDYKSLGLNDLVRDTPDDYFKGPF